MNIVKPKNVNVGKFDFWVVMELEFNNTREKVQYIARLIESIKPDDIEATDMYLLFKNGDHITVVSPRDRSDIAVIYYTRNPRKIHPLRDDYPPELENNWGE